MQGGEKIDEREGCEVWGVMHELGGWILKRGRWVGEFCMSRVNGSYMCWVGGYLCKVGGWALHKVDG